MFILLYNNAHIGDIFIGQQIVKNIIKCNPTLNINFWSPNNRFIMNDISNALFLPPVEVENNLKHFLLYNNHFIFSQMPQPNFLMINFWIAAIRDFTPGIDIECNPDLIQDATIVGLNKIKELYSVSINYTKLSKMELIPHIPSTNIDKFTYWKQQNMRKTLFYFNYTPKSYQLFPFSEPYNENHIDIINHIIKANPNILILVPSWSTEVHPNIIDCSQVFDCNETVSCENIYKLCKISSQCDYKVCFDIGSCFTFFNSQFSENLSYILHISSNPAYYNKFKTYLDSVNLNTEKYINVMCKSKEDIKTFFSLNSL